MHKLSEDLRTKLLEEIINNVTNGNAFLITEDYKYNPVKTELSLKKMQELVGGYIEVYPTKLCSNIAYFLCDEDGIIKNRNFNFLFYDIFELKAVGNVLIVPKKVFNEK